MKGGAGVGEGDGNDNTWITSQSCYIRPWKLKKKKWKSVLPQKFGSLYSWYNNEIGREIAQPTCIMFVDKTNFGLVLYNYADFYRFAETSSYWSVKWISVFLCFSLVNQRYTSGITMYNRTVTNIENTVRAMHSCSSWLWMSYQYTRWWWCLCTYKCNELWIYYYNDSYYETISWWNTWLLYHMW